MATLVTGGAGYVGSHTVLALLDRGDSVVVVDDFSTGHWRWRADRLVFIEGNVSDRELLRRVFRHHDIDEVAHLAGSTVVPESISDPLTYYRNNAAASLTLIEEMVRAGVDRLVFSSTAAVYASNGGAPVDEHAPLAPASPYGSSKLMVEGMIRDLCAAGALRAGILRYFNVAGADPAGRAGQSTPEATHLIKVACEAACGRRDGVTVFGTDWPTPDGSGVRDYIHVSDLAAAHVLMLDHLREGGDSQTLNCGYGHGYSVRQVLAAVERVQGAPLNVRHGPRRPGDVAQVVARADRLRESLGWRPQLDKLDTIVGHALAWERRRDRPAGRAGHGESPPPAWRADRRETDAAERPAARRRG